MTDQEIINEAIEIYKFGAEICDVHAKVIAKYLHAKLIAKHWHNGQKTRLYALASTGSIDNTNGYLGEELEITQALAEWWHEAEEILALKAYIKKCGTRGPQRGWSEIRW